MLSMEDIEETEIDDTQQASTSMAEQTKHSPRIRSPRIHPKPEATNGPSNRRFSPQKQSSSLKPVDSSPPKQTSSFQRSDPPPKSSDNSKSRDSPSKVSESSKVGRSSPNILNGDDSDSHMGTNGDQHEISNQDLLFECAKKGDVAGIRNVLKSNNEVDAETEEVSDADKVSVDVYDQDGLTALHYAARAHHHAAVQVLLENKADVRKNSESHLTPLMYACRNEPTSKSLSDQVSTVEKLLDRGASQTDKDRDGFNALHHCALCGPLEICQLLIEKANGADIINATTKQGWTPLHIAVMQWDIDKPGKNRRNMVEYFIRNKNKLDDEDENKRTPLHIAAIKGNVDVAKLLLNSQKIDVDCKDEDGNTPLMLASKYGNKELIDLLIGENKCKIVHQNKDGMTALHYAALYGKKDAVAKLLQRGPKELVNKVTKSVHRIHQMQTDLLHLCTQSLKVSRKLYRT
ncbi:ankyrin-3-like [Mya arenaria]|uniref:ankyrin-3-like n=1 Tax=Mya arenaria TaxID=6604 RepID=UPI0022E19268|nr:ankyrin-3-like [Mya arenaria]